MKIYGRVRTLVGIITLYVAAITLAIGAANAVNSTTPAYAASHCTRYGTYATVDTNCYIYATLSNLSYSTPSVALRDTNQITMTTQHSWALYYDDNSGPYKSGSGYGGTETRSSPGYQPAQCYASHQSAITGFCMTNWHD